jgi:exodeoxyribonuclease V alpha subunit
VPNSPGPPSVVGSTTITGEVERVTYENEQTGFRVLRVGSLEGEHARRGPLPVVGVFQPVGPGTRVRASGTFVVDSRHGEQFRADTLLPLEPSTLEGLEKYLASGVIPGIGPGFAKRIVETFGLDSFRVLDTDPDRLARVPGIGARRVQEIKRSWSTKRATAEAMLALGTHGVSPALAARIIQRYGDRALSVVERSPYRLALEVPGIGFKTADRIARSLGIAGDHPERVQAGVVHELEALSEEGHVFATRPLLVERAAHMLEVDGAHVEAAIDHLWAGERVVVEDDSVYLVRLHRAEAALARGVARLLASPARILPGFLAAVTEFEREQRIELAPAQREAIEAAARHSVVVITGGPGVGKTTIVRAILRVLERARLSVALAAPTGRAARRLAEATRREASTIHRLLEVDPKTLRFQRTADRPLALDALIVDEASMVDLPLATALVSALPDRTRLVIVGDADQLPSVGPGAVLRDLIASERVSTVRLSEIFRQADRSRIVENAHRIFRGEMPEGGNADEPNADFFVIARRAPEAAAELIRELVTRRIPQRFGFDPFTDVQVLTPMHRGPAGTTALNGLLQTALNPRGPALEVRGQMLRVGDKVMQIKNDYERDVFNGDIGQVSALDPEDRCLSVRFEDREVRYEDADLESLVLAYATSIHKSQGSEYPAVVVPMLTTHFVMLSRNLLYTAVTRARRLCVLVADPRALHLALAETRREDRMTKLAARLRRSER